MFILSVIPIAKSIHSEVLSYFSAKDVDLGHIVSVPLRNKTIRGIVVHKESVKDMKSQLRGANFQIRNITDIHDEQLFSPAFLNACNIVKNFYATHSGNIINHMTPSVVLKDIETFGFHYDHVPGRKFEHHLLQRSLAERIIFYRSLAREYLLKKQSLHIICPTRERTRYISEHISKGIESQCFVIDSSISKKKFTELYTDKITQHPTVVISTGKFIDCPQTNKGVIVIEQESSDYYRTISQPFIDMRIFIQEYAREAGIRLVSADTALRTETFYQSEPSQNKAQIIEPLGRKIFQKGDITIIQQNKQQGIEKQTDAERFAELQKKDRKKTEGFNTLSDVAINTIKNGIKEKERIFLFVHKKSLAPSIVCNHCGNIAVSKESGLPYSLYLKPIKGSTKKERVFVCHQTGETLPAFDTCQFCGSWNVTQLGIGTQRVYEEVTQKFPRAKTFIIDGNTHQKELNEILETYHSQKTSVIIIGTQRAIPLLSHIDTSIVVSLDSYFARMSYTVHDSVLGILSTIQEKTQKTTFLQSRNIVENLLPILHDGMYRPYIKNELKERDDFFYPPFSTLITLEQTITTNQAKIHYQKMKNLFGEWNPNIFTKPARKGYVSLFTVLQVDLEHWNTQHQNSQLARILKGFDRKTIIRVNPTKLDG